MTAKHAPLFTRSHAEESTPKPLRAVSEDSRYSQIDWLIEQFHGKSSVTLELLMGQTPHQVKWPLDFSEYRVIAGQRPVSLHFCQRGYFPEVEVLRSHLLHSDLDLLTYYTCSCSSARYLQNSQDRMDWFFALDYYVDGPATPPELREEVVHHLMAWIADRSHRSRIPWVNTLNSVLQLILDDIERDGIDTAEILRDTSGYYEGFLLEFHQTLPLELYLENRAFTIGMRPEIAFCFSYLGKSLPANSQAPAEKMKELAAYLVAIQNDTLSQHKEERQEQGHLNLKAYFPDSQEYVSFLSQIYEEKYGAFVALRPSAPGPLEDLWKVCYQWVCGSLVWHLSSRRYDMGQFQILW